MNVIGMIADSLRERLRADERDPEVFDRKAATFDAIAAQALDSQLAARARVAAARSRLRAAELRADAIGARNLHAAEARP